MKIRIMSDLHLEFGTMSLDKGGDILILAGDIGVIKKPQYLDHVFKWSKLFSRVIYVAGNHEFYGSDINALDKLISLVKGSNITILENNYIVVDDVAFIGATLWTEYPSASAILAAREKMNDFHVIKKCTRKFTPEDAQSRYNISAAYIESALKKVKSAKKVVITHHGPSFLSVPERFKGDILNYSFVSSLDDLILEKGPSLWIHGHTHDSFDYNIGNTRIICNPRGYVGHELNDNFDKTLEVKI